MLELPCTCGWRCTGETKQELFEQARVHLQNCPERGGDPLDENVLRAVVAQGARPVDSQE